MDIPRDPITTQHDLERLWCALMGDLGFAGRSLWLLLVTAEGEAVPALSQIEELPRGPEEGAADGVVRLADDVRRHVAPGASVALLLSRPGHDLDDTDRAWAVALRDAARAAGVALWPLHVATDRVLRVVAPDDLAEVC